MAVIAYLALILAVTYPFINKGEKVGAMFFSSVLIIILMAIFIGLGIHHTTLLSQDDTVKYYISQFNSALQRDSNSS